VIGLVLGGAAAVALVVLLSKKETIPGRWVIVGSVGVRAGLNDEPEDIAGDCIQSVFEGLKVDALRDVTASSPDGGSAIVRFTAMVSGLEPPPVGLTSGPGFTVGLSSVRGLRVAEEDEPGWEHSQL
jgi:hypothetical protein